MRLHQQIRASIGRSALRGAVALVFVSGTALSAFGQTPPAQQPPPRGTAMSPTPILQGTALTIDEAVKMALENNLGIQIERLNPAIQVLGVARANASYAPSLFSTVFRNSSTSPPSDFLTSTGIAISTNSRLTTQAGVQQNLRWGGANYSVAFDGSRTVTNATNQIFNPQLGSGLNFQYVQPLLRNFKIDGLRQQVLIAQNNQQAADIQLQQRVTQTSRNARAAYLQLVGAISALSVAQDSLTVAETSYKNNQTRVDVGAMAPIDIVTAEAEVAANQENVIVAQAAIESAQDQLRAVIMNPGQPNYWSTRFTPSEQPTLATRDIDVDAAIKNALQNRTDLRDFRKQMESTDISLKFAQNQKLPNVDVTARYGVTGLAGTQLTSDRLSSIERSFFAAVQDVFANDFRTWSVSVNVGYPIGTSVADAAFAQARIQKQQEQTQLAQLELGVSQAVREAGRNVNTNRLRVEATRRASALAQQRLEADNKRFAVGLANTFELLQSQRDLSLAKQRELRAIIDYNLSLIDFEAVQVAPIR